MTRNRFIAAVAGAALAASGIIGAGTAVAAPPTTPNVGDIVGVPAEVPNSPNPKIAAWQDLQFGLFMHWGVYSMFEGRYKGEAQVTGYPEQIKAWKNIPKDEYLAEARKMTAQRWDAGHICRTAKAAGMKYVMITTKHHDGFAMWDTATTTYDVVEQTGYGKDPIKELQNECAKVDMKLAFYYSIIDWEKHEAEPYGNVNPITDEHVQYNLDQITELLTNYGPIAEFWFDMGGPTAAQSKRMADKVRELQPNTTVVNSRVWNDQGDFEVGGDNAVPTDFRIGPWESILSIFPQCWSYCSTYKANRADSNILPKSREALNGLITVVSGGGQYAYNIGPKGDGSIDPFDQKVLDNLAAWRTRHPDAINGAKATWFGNPSWGRITTKGNALYLFPRTWEAGNTLTLPGVANQVSKVTIDGTDTQLPFTRNGLDLTVTMQGDNPDELRAVIKVELDGPARMVPTETVTLTNGLGTIDTENVIRRSGAKRGAVVVSDAYVVDRSGKNFKHVELTFNATGLQADQRYKISFGDKSVVLSGAEIEAGAISPGFTLGPNEVKRLRIELADPSYYANPLGVRINSIEVVATENPQEGIAPSWRTQPKNVEVREGRIAVFSASAVGRPSPSYQWYRADADGEPVAIPDATASTYSLTTTAADNGAVFTVVARNASGEITSEGATLTVTPPSANLAFEKNARQSTTSWGGLPARAVDGNTDGVWDNNSVTHTREYGDEQWWEVDLDADYKVTTVNVWNRARADMCGATSCADRLADFYVVASPTPFPEGSTSASLAADSQVRAIKVDGVGGYPSVVDFQGFKARYLRVIQTKANTALSLAEVEVKGTPAAEAPTLGTIDASGKPAEHFSSAGDGQSRTITARVGTEITLTTAVGGDPTPTIKWQQFADGEWSDIAEATAPTYTFTLTTKHDGTSLRAVATNAVGSVESQTIELKVLQVPVINSLTLETQAGEAVELTDAGGWKVATVADGTKLVAKAAVSGQPEPSLVWQRRVANDEASQWTTIEGATTSSYALTANAELNGTLIRVVASNPAEEVASTPIHLMVKPTPSNPDDPKPINPSDPTMKVTFSATQVAAGGTIDFTVSGFEKGDKVTFEVHSEPYKAGEAIADDNGVARLTWKIPADFPAGTHHLHAYAGAKKVIAAFSITPKDTASADQGKTADTSKASVKTGSTKVGKSALARTGANGDMLLILTALLAAAGLGATAWRRRNLR
ncbi:alpha-L-fucosidase [Schaalia suimastitidis]|uniref:alpha-L-fucosidase n=1 Tax=Schaalia suimastitidis TaxID=121163 RepID=UPI00040CD919|nr:alpha-L-fucosidase [Schaalia suimastitidis]